MVVIILFVGVASSGKTKLRDNGWVLLYSSVSLIKLIIYSRVSLAASPSISIILEEKESIVDEVERMAINNRKLKQQPQQQVGRGAGSSSMKSGFICTSKINVKVHDFESDMQALENRLASCQTFPSDFFLAIWPPLTSFSPFPFASRQSI